MSRITDTERGARIAEEQALHVLHPDLFPELLSQDEQAIWWGILAQARAVIDEGRWSREVMAAA